MKERTIQVVIDHLRELEDDFWGLFSVRLREGEAEVIVKEQTIKIRDEKRKPARR